MGQVVDFEDGFPLVQFARGLEQVWTFPATCFVRFMPDRTECVLGRNGLGLGTQLTLVCDVGSIMVSSSIEYMPGLGPAGRIQEADGTPHL